MPRWRGVRLQLVLGAPIRTRHWAHRLRCAAAIRALSSAVLGPVESPPWKRQRRLPGSTLTKTGGAFWVQAPQRGRSFRRSGEPSPASPSSARRLHLPPIPQAKSDSSVACCRTDDPTVPMPEIPIFFGHAGQRLLGERGLNGDLARSLLCCSSSSIRAVIWRTEVMFCKVPRKSP